MKDCTKPEDKKETPKETKPTTNDDQKMDVE